MQTKGFIYHLVPLGRWEKALVEGRYAPESLVEEGFVHCSTEEHILESARLHMGQFSELVVLRLLVKKLKKDLKWEYGRDGVDFPHYYNEVPFDAIDDTLMISQNDKGDFDWDK